MKIRFKTIFYSRNKIFSLLILISLWFISTNILAQSSTLFRAVVLSEEDGNPLTGSNVVLYSNVNGTEEIKYCVTDTDGFCEIRNLTPGREYQLQISFLGFQTYEELITLQSGERKILQIALKVSIQDIDDVNIIEAPYITTGEAGVRRISNVDIMRVPSPGTDGDLASYLQTVPGVITSGDRGGDLYIRGGAPDQNLFLIDNIPVFKPIHISNLFSAFPGNSIQNVNMFAGGFGADYSGATSAVIDISLKNGNIREHKSSAAISPYLLSLQTEGPVIKDRHSYFFSGRHSVIKSFGPYLSGENIPLEFYDIMGKYSIRENNISCSFTALHTYDTGEIVPDRDTMHSWSNTAVGGRCFGYAEYFDHPFEVTAGYSNYQNTEGNTEKAEIKSAYYQFVMNLDLQESISDQQVNYGLGFKFPLYKTKLDQRFKRVKSFKIDNAIFNFYSILEWKLSDRLVLQPGFVSQYSLVQPVTFEPRLRASFIPDKNRKHELSIAVGKYVQFMSGISDGRDVGTVFIVLKPTEQRDVPQEALHGILSYKFDWRDFNLHVESFVKDHKNITVAKWNPEVGLETETTLANGFTYGFDARLEFERNRFYSAIGYGYSKVEYSAQSGDLGAWIKEPVFSYSPAHDQRHKLNSVFSYSFSGFTANARW